MAGDDAFPTADASTNDPGSVRSARSAGSDGAAAAGAFSGSDDLTGDAAFPAEPAFPEAGASLPDTGAGGPGDAGGTGGPTKAEIRAARRRRRRLAGPMKVWPGLVQRTEQWFRARAGRPTASRMDRVITPAGRDSRAWEEYAIELVAQTVRPEDGAWEGNAWTQRRYGLEPQARADFMEVTRLSVEPVGFVTRGDGVAGCSPDGLVRRRDAEGWPRGRFFAGLELTCPLPKNHARHLVEGVLPARFRPQVHGAMAITGLREWYFMSYCPGLAPFILRVRRDDYTERVADALERFFIYYADRRKRLLPRLLGKEEEG